MNYNLVFPGKAINRERRLIWLKSIESIFLDEVLLLLLGTTHKKIKLLRVNNILERMIKKIYELIFEEVRI